MKKSHLYVNGIRHGFAITPLLQSHLLEFSTDLPFERAAHLIKTAIPSARTSSSQAQRLTQYYGNLEQTEQLLQQPGFGTCSQNEAEASQAKLLYVQADGGHLSTDEGYRETKVGRVFAAQQIRKISSDCEGVMMRNSLEKSDYLAHLGSHAEFTARLNPLINAHLKSNPDARMIAISDGADWIASWIKRDYPEAVIILDFYHAVERIGEFASMVFSSAQNRSAWVENRKEELAAGQVDKVIMAIRSKAVVRRKAIIDKSLTVIGYLEKNKYRMKYNEYRAHGYCIGSGAIESAISTVLQQRCKLVGQRWTQRVEAVLNIRSVFKSGKRAKLRRIISRQMGYSGAA